MIQPAPDVQYVTIYFEFCCSETVDTHSDVDSHISPIVLMKDCVDGNFECEFYTISIKFILYIYIYIYMNGVLKKIKQELLQA